MIQNRGWTSRISSAFNECINLEGLLPFELSFINERHIKVTISMKVFIAPIPYDLLMGISSMRVHHIVSQHFPKLFDDQSDLSSDSGAQTLLIENNGVIDCLRGDNSHTVASTCSCHIDGGTPQPNFLLQLKEPNSVISERIPRVQNELV